VKGSAGSSALELKLAGAAWPFLPLLLSLIIASGSFVLG
jgi:hypothetical protein